MYPAALVPLMGVKVKVQSLPDRRKRSSWIPLSFSCFWCHCQGTSGTGWGILELSWRLVAVLGFCGLSKRRASSAGAHPGGCWLCKAWAAVGPIFTPESFEDCGFQCPSPMAKKGDCCNLCRTFCAHSLAQSCCRETGKHGFKEKPAASVSVTWCSPFLRARFIQ